VDSRLTGIKGTEELVNWD